MKGRMVVAEDNLFDLSGRVALVTGGAKGLGADILAGINMLEFGKGLLAGLGIVALAIVIDRISQGLVKGAESQGVS